jgi:2-keto-4-pentenoate hydratase/2-oxohepta-3-ene-1,7-dioic acid hydratase in catechol pathway
MKYCRFQLDNQALYGSVEDRSGEPWIVALAPAPQEDLAYRLQPSPPTAFTPIPLSNATLLPPVTPSKIVCVGRNYREHVKELGNEMPAEPLLFYKPPSSLLPPGGVIRLPKASVRVDFEGELALVIGRRSSKLKPGGDFTGVVRGLTLANDISARDLQKKDVQWARAKGFDTFCPIGPWVSDELDPEPGLTIETHLNGELRQHGSTADFIFTIRQLLVYITAAITLEPGDVLLTGTPSGVGPMVSGDRVEVSMAGLGVLSNTVASEGD